MKVLYFIHSGVLESALTNINPAESEAWKNEVGSYIDDGFLIDFLTPEEYFAFLGKISGMTQAEVDQRLEAFERFAGGEIFGQKKLIRNLSAGNKQKVGIISALLRKPKTVILDEPFNFLDPTSQLVLKHLITDYAKETGATIIISSHNLQHTVDISTRIALLEHGRSIPWTSPHVLLCWSTDRLSATCPTTKALPRPNFKNTLGLNKKESPASSVGDFFLSDTDYLSNGNVEATLLHFVFHIAATFLAHISQNL